jgi:hypothetical protein
MKVRDRIRELRRVKAGQLRPHPKNWRRHPPLQHDALRGLLAEIGYAGALLARPLADGSLQLIDGHLRAEITPEMEVPVLVVDLDDEEAAKLLALHDPLAGLAEPDGPRLAELLRDVESENESVRAVLDQMLASASEAREALSPKEPPPEVSIPEAFQVVVECRDEAEQQALYQRLTAEGLHCRLLTL